VEVLKTKSAILDEHGAAVGRDTAALVERSVKAEGPPQASGDALVAAGATLFTIGQDGPDYDLSEVKAWIDWRDERR
jgi:hypothetical protein